MKYEVSRPTLLNIQPLLRIQTGRPHARTFQDRAGVRQSQLHNNSAKFITQVSIQILTPYAPFVESLTFGSVRVSVMSRIDSATLTSGSSCDISTVLEFQVCMGRRGSMCYVWRNPSTSSETLVERSTRTECTTRAAVHMDRWRLTLQYAKLQDIVALATHLPRASLDHCGYQVK